MVDADDILETINTWGPCSGCGADVNGDDAIDVTDLLTILSGWGTCP